MKKYLCGLLCLIMVGCSNSNQNVNPADVVPQFTFSYSEYPSWAVFGVAHEKGYIDGAPGKQGEYEKKWNVDIVLKLADYDSCITLYSTAAVDATCLTNMDSLSPSIGRATVAILPTSTSVGADALIVVGIDNLDDLKNHKTYGLEKAVPQYVFERNLEIAGKKPADYTFANMDPSAAAQALQTKQPNINSIIVWNPFVLQTLRNRADAKVLFDSSAIPEEVIDLVVVGKDILQKTGGDRFASCLVETYYRVNQDLQGNSTEADETLVDLGRKFSSLGLEDMKIVVKQTQFYSNPESALKLFNSEKFRNETTPHVVDFCLSHNIIDAKPSVGFDDENAQFNFSTKYLNGATK